MHCTAQTPTAEVQLENANVGWLPTQDHALPLGHRALRTPVQRLAADQALPQSDELHTLLDQPFIHVRVRHRPAGPARRLVLRPRHIAATPGTQGRDVGPGACRLGQHAEVLAQIPAVGRHRRHDVRALAALPARHQGDSRAVRRPRGGSHPAPCRRKNVPQVGRAAGLQVDNERRMDRVGHNEDPRPVG